MQNQVLIRETYRGKVTRVCDRRCYDATGQQCHCVCGGMNHGVGLAAAQVRTYAYNECLTIAHATAKQEARPEAMHTYFPVTLAR